MYFIFVIASRFTAKQSPYTDLKCNPSIPLGVTTPDMPGLWYSKTVFCRNRQQSWRFVVQDFFKKLLCNSARATHPVPSGHPSPEGICTPGNFTRSQTIIGETTLAFAQSHIITTNLSAPNSPLVYPPSLWRERGFRRRRRGVSIVPRPLLLLLAGC
jgi:hypothetical protein